MLETLAMTPKKYSLQPAILKDIPIFAAFSPTQLQDILETSPSVLFDAGQVILKEGEVSDFLYLVLEGSLKIQREDSSGVVYNLGELSRGQICGELSLLRREPSNATVTAVTASSLLAISRATLANIIRLANPEQVLNIFFTMDAQNQAASLRGFKEILSRRNLALQLEVEKQRALTQMVAGVAHEVNTPLGVINAAVILMARELATAPKEMTAQRAAEIAESLELMKLNVERADQLLQGFRKISISQLVDEKETFNIVELIEETLSLIAFRLKQKRVQVKFNNLLSAKDNQWVGYRGLLSQVIINLLTNVERYAYPNGSSGIAEVSIRLDDTGKQYCLSVRDYGAGISPENQAQIFEPFFTTGKHIGGSGLGLSIINKIITNTLKGGIECRSEEGKGTEFIVTFPRVIE